ncbi:hypothetical protein KCU81_g4159, partial [Aureobasidium melanogenum]|uniref:Uncharacterized protein n=1 Tax=Aureobasidium melanogenum (strain CBS 110374) TaxID=1043003 RepID=A0A074WD61_AURM1
MSSSWEDDDETATAVAGCLRRFRDLVGLDSARVTPDLEREMARRTRGLMAGMLSQQHQNSPTTAPNGLGLLTPGTSASTWSTSAEVLERLQAVQREGRRKVQAKKLERIQNEQQEESRRAEEEERDRVSRWRKAQEEAREQAARAKAQNAAAARARADAAAVAALKAQKQEEDRAMLNNFRVQQRLNIQHFKQQDHFSLRLRHTRAGQAMREFFARAKAQAEAEVDQLRAQQIELALASAQQDLDRLTLQHDPINAIEAARRAALQERARQAEEDRLRVEGERAARAEAERLAQAEAARVAREQQAEAARDAREQQAEAARVAAARQAEINRLAAAQQAENERQRARDARQTRLNDETALSGESQLTIIIDQWQADFLQVVHPLGYHTELYRAVAHLWLVDENQLGIVQRKCQTLWNAVLSGDEED